MGSGNHMVDEMDRYLMNVPDDLDAEDIDEDFILDYVYDNLDDYIDLFFNDSDLLNEVAEYEQIDYEKITDNDIEDYIKTHENEVIDIALSNDFESIKNLYIEQGEEY